MQQIDLPNNNSQEIANPAAYWESLNKERKIIKDFLKSLNKKVIGEGQLVCVNNYKFEPRSSYSNYRIPQYIATIGNDTANFDSTEGNFIAVKEKVEKLIKELEKFRPASEDDCSIESQRFYNKLLRLQSIIKTTAKDGLKQLSENYGTYYSQKEKNLKLKVQGKDLFNKVNILTDSLKIKLENFISNIKEKMTLEDCLLKARKLVQEKERDIADGRNISWTPENGTRIQYDMVVKSHKNIKMVKKLSIGEKAVKNAANSIKLSTQAIPIPSQNGSAEWVPFRIQESYNGEIYFEPGTVGICENSKDDLCNLYSKFDPRTENYTILTGAINTPFKGKEFIALILDLKNRKDLKKIPNDWVYHQLDSHSTEGELINAVQAQVKEIETNMKINQTTSMKISQTNFCLMSVNTPFNVASTYLGDQKFAADINKKSWSQIIKIAEVKILTSLSLTQFKYNDNIAWIEFNSLVEKPLNEVQEKLELIQNKIKPLKENLLSQIQLNSENKPHYDQAILILKIIEMLLASHLKLIGAPLISPITEIELYFLLYRILGFSVIISCADGLDRTAAAAAIDDSLSRLVQILLPEHEEKVVRKKIIKSNQGIEEDQLGERCKYFTENLTDGLKQDIKLTATIDVYTAIFDLIINLDINRTTIFKLTDQAMKDLSFSLTPEEKTFIPANRVEGGFRQKIMEKVSYIAEINKYEENNKQLNDQDEIIKNNEAIKQLINKAEVLRNTLYYLEIFATHLLGTQNERIFYSSGVWGFKYHYETGKVLRTPSANPYPLDRLPPFIFTENDDPIQLHSYTEGIFSTKIKLTPLGETVIFGLSELR